MANEKGKFVDVGCERAVISSILQHPDLIVDAATKISEKDFLSEHHQTIYSIVKSLFEQGVRSFDIVAVIDSAEKRSALSTIGGPEYLQALYQTNFDPRNFSVYLNKLADCATKYRLYLEAQYIQQDLLSAGEDANSEQLIAKAEGRILDISLECKRVEDAVNIASGLRERLKVLAESPVEITGLTTGITLMDKALNGLASGSLTIIAGRMKGGKSTLMMNMAAHQAFDLGLPVLYIDTEMNRNEVQTRLLSHLSRVPERAIVTGKFIENEEFCRRVNAACTRMEEGLFLHRYYPGFTVDGVVSLARKYHAREGIGALYFDYIKEPEYVSGAAKEHQILGRVATALKDCAGRLNIPVVAGAQLKRPEGQGEKSHYSENDVADSDRIGRYCNTLAAIARKSKKEIEEDGEDCGTHRLQLLLARGGGAMYRGIDLHCHFPTLTMRQADNQSNGIPNFDGVKEELEGW